MYTRRGSSTCLGQTAMVGHAGSVVWCAYCGTCAGRAAEHVAAAAALDAYVGKRTGRVLSGDDERTEQGPIEKYYITPGIWVNC